MNDNDKRRCGWCDKVIYYGLYCSNECSDKAYGKWRDEERLRKVMLDYENIEIIHVNL